MHFLCTATGVLCFVFRKGGEICTGTERERGGGEGEGEEGVSRNDGGKYERERKVMEGFDSFDFLLPSPSSRVYQQIATYIVCTRLS